jgi:hypothetical protein
LLTFQEKQKTKTNLLTIKLTILFVLLFLYLKKNSVLSFLNGSGRVYPTNGGATAISWHPQRFKKKKNYTKKKKKKIILPTHFTALPILLVLPLLLGGVRQPPMHSPTSPFHEEMCTVLSVGSRWRRSWAGLKYVFYHFPFLPLSPKENAVLALFRK